MFMRFAATDFFFQNQPVRNTTRVSNSLDPGQARRFSGLIRVQTVWKIYQQTTLGDKELNDIVLTH